MVIGHITQSQRGLSHLRTIIPARTNTPGAALYDARRGRRPGGVACAHKRPPLSSCSSAIVGDAAYWSNGNPPMLADYALPRKALNV